MDDAIGIHEFKGKLNQRPLSVKRELDFDSQLSTHRSDCLIADASRASTKCRLHATGVPCDLLDHRLYRNVANSGLGTYSYAFRLRPKRHREKRTLSALVGPKPTE